MFEKRFLTLNSPPPTATAQGIPLTFLWVFVGTSHATDRASFAVPAKPAATAATAAPATAHQRVLQNSWAPQLAPNVQTCLAEAPNMQISVRPVGDYSQQSHQQ